MDTIDQLLKDALGNAVRVSKDYAEGGFLMVRTDFAFIRYNTGDCVWFDVVEGNYRVSRIDTSDDLVLKF
jgi:hypothetical protein